MKRTASAIWRGGFKDGSGEISTQSGALKSSPYAVASRFEDRPGTNPEELLGAAHAGCFVMALSLILGEAGLTAETLDAKAEVTLEKQAAGYAVTSSHLILRAKIPGATPETFGDLAAKAKAGCPISKALGAIEVTLDAALV